MLNSKIKILFLILFITFFSVSFFGNLKSAQAEGCTVTSAIFSPSGKQNDDWYVGAKSPSVGIYVATTGCKGRTLQASIKYSNAFNADRDIPELDHFPVPMTDNVFMLSLSAGETTCLQNPSYDCLYYISIYGADGGDFSTKTGPISFRQEGYLQYDCDGVCFDSWKLLNSKDIVFGEDHQSAVSKFVTLQKDNPAAFKSNDTIYTPLAPLPGLGDPGCTRKDASGKETPCIDTAKDCAFGKYLNIMIKLIIGLITVFAVVMITIGGLEYMTSELISSKEAGKDRIRNAILGLIIALGAYLILNTINPDLLNVCLTVPKVEITIEPDAGDDIIDPNFAKGIKTYTSEDTVSPQVTAVVEKLKQGWEISHFHVAKNSTMVIGLKKGSEVDNNSVINIAPGKRGYANIGTAQTGDGKTPSGSWKIVEIRYAPGEAQFNKKGSNMGAAFWLLNPMLSGERGIGMHGNKTGTLYPTNGCIRLKNADILALEPYIKVGIPVLVDN